MQRTTLGRTGIEVSAWCLGTMTWGRQTAAQDAHAQIERAFEAGIDFMDAAEMYPVNPVRPETVGDTETIIGDWFAASGRRDDWVLATKMTGADSSFVNQRPVTPETLRAAVEGSLRRLRTDRIDLYQLHWPSRGSYMFRQNWRFDPTTQAPAMDDLHEMAEAMAGLIREGKIRAFGPSNESAWGMTRWNDALRAAGVEAGVASVQNEYSLLCRLYDTDLAEASHQEGFTLLAFSPLAAGILTDKYRGGARPEGSRLAVGDGNLGGRFTERALAATAAYTALAERHGIDPVHMAMAFCAQRPFHTIPIFGATTMEQLERLIAGIGVTLSGDLLEEIDEVHRAHPMPY